MFLHAPTRAERDLIAAARTTTDPDERAAARILLAQGRLFTPGLWPAAGAPRRGAPAHCFANALRVAHRTGGAYVEGFVLAAGSLRRHAWCVRADGAVLDPTWPRGEAAQAYLGVPMAPWFVDAFQQRTLTKTCFLGVLDPRVQAERDAGRIYDAGVPALAVLDLGTPVHPGARPGDHDPSTLAR
ncbi:hypothetical protein [Kitasatospora purpeofusca]|uniref:hypothetical protein n=1 Tax=Kitasatospora purpeofusca TaxID=67352 RepID=UPI00386DC12C|nr:hypothetical protein OIP63_00315 [Kitasatospora purpeofusca]